jgi:hypothetical protein
MVEATCISQMEDTKREAQAGSKQSGICSDFLLLIGANTSSFKANNGFNFTTDKHGIVVIYLFMKICY